MAGRERFVFLVRCALLAALLASLWGFYGTYLSPAARADGEDGPKSAVFGARAALVYSPYVKDGSGARAVVERFLAARRRGDARAACREMSVNARRLVAWRVTERPQPRSEAGCERYILTTKGERGVPNPRIVALFERHGFVIERDEHTIGARPRGVRGWVLEMIGERGRFWIEEGGTEHSDWRAVDCARYGYRGRTCECIWEKAQLKLLRRWGPRYGLLMYDRVVREVEDACV